jgi:simple sugar transport system ATP-binding protein
VSVAAGAGDTPLVEVRDIGKRFGSVEALRDVRLRVERGEVLALLGDNGAGKSTLIKVLSGLYAPDRGEIFWRGERVRFRSPRDAQELGIATVYQDLAVCNLMSIYRNVALGREDDVSKGIGPFKWIDRRRARQQATEALAAIGIHIRSADEPVGKLSGGERQSIAIARGVHFSASLLILDEPTSALSIKQSARVLKSIEAARAAGLAVIVISHNVHHVYPVADRYMVLSHGSTVAEFRRGERTKEEISELIAEGQLLERELDRAEAT